MAAENELLRVKPTREEKLREEALGPGLHLSVSQPAGRSGSSMIFRDISSMPYIVYGFALLMISLPVTMAASVALLLTGEYSPPLFAYNRHMLRYLVRLDGHAFLVKDMRPPLSGASPRCIRSR